MDMSLLGIKDPFNLFIYANCVTGTNRRIEASEVTSIEVLENGLAVRHEESSSGPRDIGDDIAEGVHGMLPAQVQNKVERLEIKLKTKTGGPPLGYSIPVIEQEVSPTSSDYVKLKNEMVNLASRWRQMYGIA